MKFKLLLSAFLSAHISIVASAEVWKCGSVYTNNPEKHNGCVEVEGSKVCGSGGNKFFSPQKLSGSTDDPCKPSKNSISPFVDLKSEEFKKSQKAETLQVEKARTDKIRENFNNSKAQQGSTLADNAGTANSMQEGKSLQDSFGKLSDILSGQ